MNDNEIIKALEICNSLHLRCGNGCPYYEVPYKNGKRCSKMMIEDALDLINHQKAEIEQWKEEANKYQNLWCEAMMDMQTTKTEAIKDFAERVKNECESGWLEISESDFDNLVAEMTEGRENDN